MSDTIATAEQTQPAREADAAEIENQPTEVDWKAKSREWERRAKENKAAADELAAIRDSQKTEAEKAAERLAQAEQRVAEAEARAARRDTALEFRLTAEDAALLDAVSDPDAMRSLAARLASVADERKRLNPVPSEGSNQQPADNPKRDFARQLFGRDD